MKKLNEQQIQEEMGEKSKMEESHLENNEPLSCQIGSQPVTDP